MRRTGIFLIITIAAFELHASEPVSAAGNVDCGKDFIATHVCPVKVCHSDADCPRPPDSPIGGLPYACLPDVHVCGWKDPTAALRQRRP